ncbi:hypothetical protein [Azospirillum thermophilum]|uniref:PRC-barrel domain-containing protein n=1 Tax=Azospirillum thermophilum TaxID=2202148 RepID=A0A2S2CL03_9PROT|nr:hypothetical protein [Azospirillum thermophilum]AWK85152.1 hypothetical protein DEW08_02215 [Azospirillum thermophilum]
MKTPTRRPAAALAGFALCAPMLALGACAGTVNDPAPPVAELPPLQVVGLTLQSRDGSRVLGNIKDLVIAPDGRIQQAIVESGSPMYTTARRVAVDSSALRYAPNLQTVRLSGMSAEEFAALPAPGSAPAGYPATGPADGAATNWYGVRVR